MRVPRRKSEEFRKYRDSGGPLHVTAAGLERLKSQLHRAQYSLPALISEVQRTGAFGDFSENAEYQTAKHLLRRAHGRVASLKDKIKRSVLITQEGQSGQVQIGSAVVLERAGKRITFEILGSLETDPLRGRISSTSPLGAALMRRKAGEIITIDTMGGSVEYRIVDIK